MSHLTADLITRWVLLVQRHGRFTLAAVLALSTVSAVLGAHLFTLNSDVGQLIRPGDDTRWYAQNEDHKRAFPQFENTAIVVVSGPDVAAITQRIKHAPGVIAASQSGLQLRVIVGPQCAEPSATVQQLAGTPYRVLPAEATIEDVFVVVTGEPG